MFSSLRVRLWFSYALLIAAALSLVAVVLFVYLLRNPVLYRQRLERLKSVETLIGARDDQPLDQKMEKAARVFNVRIVLFSGERTVLADTNAKNSELSFPEKGFLSRKIPTMRDSMGKIWIYSISQMDDGSWLMVATPRPRLSVLNIFTDDFLPLFFQGGALALILSLIMALFFARWIADPLQNVILAARAMPSAEAKPVEARGPREVQELTRAFNSMVARVRSSQQSQRDFVANVSHELKTPLTSIQGFSQAMLDGTAESPEARRQAAEVIHNESARMFRMVVDLLDLARLDAGTADITMARLDMAAILNATVEKFTPQIQRADVSMAVDVPANLPALIGDGDRLAQVFTNLVDNALKFTPRGGRIALSAQVLGGELHVSVTDTGVGIPADALPHIFDRFYQVDPSRKGGERHGAGLGLAIAEQIVKAHGGRISVRSGKTGTTFDVFLPLAKR